MVKREKPTKKRKNIEKIEKRVKIDLIKLYMFRKSFKHIIYMSKTKKIHARKRNRRVKSRKMMKGGQLSPDEEQNLINQGFNQEEINTLNEHNISMNVINQANQYYHNNAHQLIVQFAIQMNNPNNDENSSMMSSMHGSELDLDEGIPHAPDDVHDLVGLDDLNVSNISSDSGNTSIESHNSIGGKKNMKRKTKKMRGGTCYGRGVGANSYDPNLSIYNTNMLRLFPYKAQ